MNPQAASTPSQLQIRTNPEKCCNESWEEAYCRFETPQQEINKFVGRLRKMGVEQWHKDSRVLEIFCGRGNGMHALTRLGFTHVEGADLSASLLGQYKGPAKTHVVDCRTMPFEANQYDAVLVQGGVHHLPDLKSDLGRVLAECQRILKADGKFCLVEPWRTSFLELVHFASQNRMLRRCWPKLDAFAVMTENEIETYEQWLNHGPAIETLIDQYFQADLKAIAWGKMTFVGRPHFNSVA